MMGRGLPELSELATSDPEWRTRLRATFAKELYGPIPAPPDRVEHKIEATTDGHHKITLSIHCGDRRFDVSAALWMSPKTTAPVPVIVALDFLGPFGILPPGGFPADPAARVYSAPEWQAEGRLVPGLAGQSRPRWPLGLIAEHGFAVMVSCYGSWVPDDAETWRDHGVSPLLNHPNTGAISLWAWALMRMVDVAVDTPVIDRNKVILAGHSRLGKAALWATAHDNRVAGLWANNSGCAGTALSRHLVGETLAQLTQRFPHWLRHGAVTNPDAMTVDQHQLLALCAPARVYLSEAEEDTWADPEGSWAALALAAKAYGLTPPSVIPTAWNSGAFGFHLRPGGHDVLMQDWRATLKFFAKNL
ncbi:hypothetical protein [uncultured Pelagimonas sp.]|uniref:glucuronyl esterase domain-containing protein n=1 Tax=uncultured Pelagimonas sp. TaxID=1618102 RepID=UPI0026108AB0|nr:hypothetical protein [uncultured Pelagimonas sp.]